MKITKNVVQDLLPVYLAGEAHADTTALVEEYLRGDAEMARSVEGMRGNPLPAPAASLRPSREKETLELTRRLLRWRGILMGIGIFLMLFPFSVRFGGGQVTWLLQDAPAYVTAVVWSGAAVCWGAFLYVRRRLRGTGL